MVKSSHLFMINKMSLLDLIVDLINKMTSLYDTDLLSIPTLNQFFKKILSDFSQRCDIPKVDIFAILNSLRKMDEIPFEYDSKNWTFCFSNETSLTSGKSKMIITVESSMIIGIFQKIIDLLDPIQKDLLFLMYRSILRERAVSPKIPYFELTIHQNYQYWCDFLKWETERESFLINCKYQFIRQPYFSGKDTKFYLNRLSRSSGYPSTPESFSHFFGRYYIWRKFFQENSNSDWNFEPMFNKSIDLCYNKYLCKRIMNKNNTPPKNYQKHMYVVFDGINVEDCKPIPLEKVLKEPEIRFDSMKALNKNKYHLFVIVDKDAMGKFYVHYCIYDIKDDNISSAQLLYHYQKPSPPMGTGKHHYFCILYEYSAPMDKEVIGKINSNRRVFVKFRDFKNLFKQNITPKASKCFVCEYGH